MLLLLAEQPYIPELPDFLCNLQASVQQCYSLRPSGFLCSLSAIAVQPYILLLSDPSHMDLSRSVAGFRPIR